jgi:hypothetical protein
MARPQFLRFLDFPTEIRHQIYREILCTFTYEYDPKGCFDQLAQILQQSSPPNGICRAAHSIETSILQVSQSVHREAYDVMVKANCFIRIKTESYNFPPFLLWSQIPVVTMDKQYAAQFQGYVLEMNAMRTDEPIPSRWGPIFDCE